MEVTYDDDTVHYKNYEYEDWEGQTHVIVQVLYEQPIPYGAGSDWIARYDRARIVHEYIVSANTFARVYLVPWDYQGIPRTIPGYLQSVDSDSSLTTVDFEGGLALREYEDPLIHICLSSLSTTTEEFSRTTGGAVEPRELESLPSDIEHGDTAQLSDITGPVHNQNN